MESMQAIKQRIESIETTKKISQAMLLVSHTKIQRARALAENSRPFFSESQKLLQTIASTPLSIANPYGEEKPVERSLFIVVGSDRGLCGGYNINTAKTAYAIMEQEEGQPHVLAIGIKIRDYFVRRGKPIQKVFSGISQNPFYSDAKEISAYALELYEAGEFQQVFLIYSHFESMLSHIPTKIRLLPLQLPPEERIAGEEKPLPKKIMRLEPEEEQLLDLLIPAYMQACLFGGLVEGAACEQSARITSMDSAVKNSGDIIDDLQLLYNQARQDTITQELNEIVSGADALG